MAGKGKGFGSRKKRSTLLSKRVWASFKRLGRALDPSLKKDFKDSILARLFGANEAVRRAFEYKEAHPTLLSVPDAETEGQFLQNAQMVYRQAHPPKKRGRKPQKDTVFLSIADLEIQLNRQPTEEEIIKRLTSRPEIVERRTATRYAKLYQLLSSKKSLSKADAQWLRKNFAPKGLSFNWWMETHDKLVTARLEANGISKQIRNCFDEARTTLTEEDHDRKIQGILEDDKRMATQFRTALQNKKKSSPSS